MKDILEMLLTVKGPRRPRGNMVAVSWSAWSGFGIRRKRIHKGSLHPFNHGALQLRLGYLTITFIAGLGFDLFVRGVAALYEGRHFSLDELEEATVKTIGVEMIGDGQGIRAFDPVGVHVTPA